MTMHLMGHAYNTVNTNKRKKKLTDSQYHKMAMELNKHNKLMRQCGLKEKSLDQYIAYRQGKYKPEIKGVVKDPMKATTYRRPSPVVPSYGDQVGSGFAKPEQKYTGERKLLGVAVMHKSNLVPVFEQKDAEELAKMRR